MDPTTRAILITALLGGFLTSLVVACSVWMLRGGPQRLARASRQRAAHRADVTPRTYLRINERPSGGRLNRRCATAPPAPVGPDPSRSPHERPPTAMYLPIDRHLRNTL